MRRLNVKLLVYLLVAVFAVVAVTAVLWRVNLTRTLEAQLIEAEKYKKEGDLIKAYEAYRRYRKQRPQDKKAAADLGLVVADLAEQENTRELKALAYQTLEYALRLDASRIDVRKRLVKYCMYVNRLQDAVQHLEILLSKTPNDGELEANKAQCHVALGENALADEFFKLSLEHAPDRIETYMAYAQWLDRSDKKAEADAIIAQMVEKNPESYKAWLAKAGWVQNLKRHAEAEGDIAKARELAPDDIDVLLMSAQLARLGQDIASAEEYLEKAKALHPKEPRVYQQLASLATTKNDPDRAMQLIDEGLKEMPNETSLLVPKAELLINKGDRDEAERTIALLRKNRYEPEGLDYLNARILILDGSNVQAAQILQSIRPLLTNRRDLRMQVNMLLARCYERLGQTDLRDDAYRRVLDDDPNNEFVKLQFEIEKMRRENTVSNANMENLPPNILTEPVRFQIELAKQLEIADPSQRDFKALDEIIAKFSERIGTMVDGEEKVNQQKILALLEAELAAQKGDMDAALAKVKGEVDKDRKDVSLWIAYAGLRDRKEPEGGMIAALDEAEKELGANVLLEQMRINHAARPGGEEAVKAILALEPRAEKVENRGDQTVLYGNMAELVFANGNYQEAQRLFGLADEKAPTPDLRIRIRRFDLAYAAQNDEDMQKLIASIADLMGKESAEYYYAEASRIVTLIDAGKMERTESARARDFVKRAREIRPRWGNLYRLEAQLDEIDGNYESAVANYEQGIELGEVTRGYVIRLMQLYYSRGEFDKAGELMAQLRVNDKDDFLAPFQSRILYAQGKLEEALALQQKTCETSTSYEEFIFLGQLHEARNKDGDQAEAEKAFRKATELGKEASRPWTTLVAFLVKLNRIQDAEAIIAELPQRLPAERMNLVVGACLEMIDKPREAEQAYAAQLATNPNSFADRRNLASFYARTEKLSQAQELLNSMLASADDAKITDQPHLAWARRTLAQIIGRTGNYQQLKQALSLLDENARGGVLGPEDVMLKASLLAARTDRTSRLQAIKMMEEMMQSRPGGRASASPAQHVLLAQMYDKEKTDDARARCQDHMFTALLNNEQNLLYLTMYIRMLLDHRQLTDAASWLEKLKTVAPTSDQYIDCNARYLAAIDKKDEALALVKDAVPDPIPALPDEVRRVLGAASLLEDIGLYKAAEEQLIRYIRQRPQEILLLASFHGRRHNIDEAIRICKEASANRTAEEVARTALLALRQCIDVAKPEHYDEAQVWVMKARDEQPNSIGVELMVADLQDLRGNYAEAAKVYEEILAKENLGEGARITAQNNLAYIRAVKFNNAKDALTLVNQALETGGPLAELLDTKAIILTMLGETDQALAMMTEALADTPNDPVKLFHLARIHAKANDLEKSKEALAKARAAGLDLKMLPLLEHESYKSLLNQLGVE